MPLLPRSISRTGQSVRWKSGAVFDLPDLQNVPRGMSADHQQPLVCVPIPIRHHVMAPVALPCARLVKDLHPQRAEYRKCRPNRSRSRGSGGAAQPNITMTKKTAPERTWVFMLSINFVYALNLRTAIRRTGL
jgi:hypothetical protein